MPSAHRSTIEVRGYELDSFGHVNHSVYVNYFEHARWKFLEDAGITLKDFNEWKLWPVIRKIEVDYLRPTYLGQKLDIESRIVEHGKTNFTVHQEIRSQGEVVCTAKVLVVVINERGRPSAFPEKMTRIF